MADKGTFTGELQRGWHRFWGLGWKIKAPVLIVLGLIVIGALGSAGGSGDDKPAKADAAETTNTPKAGETPKDTATPKPTDTPKPTAEPTNTQGPLTFEQQAAKSYKDNRGFMVRALSDPTVNWDATSGILEFRKYENANSEGDALTLVAHSALVANRAIWTTYPEVKLLQFTLVEDFTNLNTGQKSRVVSAAIMVDRTTASSFNYDGLKGVVLADNKRFFCGAPHYFINIAIYREINDKGCLGLPGKDPGVMVLD